MVEVLQREQVDFCVCRSRFVDESGKVFHISNSDTCKIMDREEAWCSLNRCGISSFLWDKMFQKRLFENCRFQADKYCEDAFLVFEILEKSEKIYCLNQVLHHYVVRQDSLSRKVKGVMDLDYIEQRMTIAEHVYEYGKVDVLPQDLYNTICFFSEAYRHLDKKDPAVIARTRELQNRVRDTYVKVPRKKIKPVYKLAFSLFFRNIDLFTFLRSHMRRVVHDSGRKRALA